MKKKTKSKKSAPKKRIVAKNASGKKTSIKKKAARKGSPSRKIVLKKVAKKAKAPAKKVRSSQTAASSSRRDSQVARISDASAFDAQQRRTRSAGQSGDLQGLSEAEAADSESVDELLEEGNAFEADVVSGVERAGDSGVREVRTHEVPEDDVPGEYLDEE